LLRVLLLHLAAGALGVLSMHALLLLLCMCVVKTPNDAAAAAAESARTLMRM
jgi:hypothetical protein